MQCFSYKKKLVSIQMKDGKVR